LFGIALRRLEQECASTGRSQNYALFQRYDLDDERPTYAELAQRFGAPVTDVTNRLFRVRRELRRIVPEVMRELTASEEEFREEARALLGDGAVWPAGRTARSSGCAAPPARRLCRRRRHGARAGPAR